MLAAPERLAGPEPPIVPVLREYFVTAFSPDGRFVVGPVSAVPGLVMAAGCNAHGVSGSAGLAMHLLESLTGDPSPYVRSLSPDRFIPRDWSWEDARQQAQARARLRELLPDARVLAGG